KINKGQRQEKQRFQKQPGNRSRARLFPQQSVEAETGAKPHCDPREMAVAEGENTNRDRSNENGGDLRGTESLVQNDGPKQDIHQRRHEIAEAGFEDVTDVNRPNEE